MANNKPDDIKRIRVSKYTSSDKLAHYIASLYPEPVNIEAIGPEAHMKVSHAVGKARSLRGGHSETIPLISPATKMVSMRNGEERTMMVSRVEWHPWEPSKWVKEEPYYYPPKKPVSPGKITDPDYWEETPDPPAPPKPKKPRTRRRPKADPKPEEQPIKEVTEDEELTPEEIEEMQENFEWED